MTNQESSLLAEALSLGYKIYIGDTGYVTGPVTSIDSENHDGKGGWTYTDDTFDEMPLESISLDQVYVYQRVDFTAPGILEQQPEDYEFTPTRLDAVREDYLEDEDGEDFDDMENPHFGQNMG